MEVNKIYKNIKEYREKNNYSLDFVAIQMEMSVKLYSKIERGKVDLKLSKLDKLAKVLGVKKSDVCKLSY
ncbi:helix-turn-helix domain-containing protein [Flavobacterium faecale]|uniref:helix-turn-helix domain-containing protein n=1 Tax=Flavobacterium faecale TaxID=1355330 RepID=UPI003AAE19D5